MWCEALFAFCDVSAVPSAFSDVSASTLHAVWCLPSRHWIFAAGCQVTSVHRRCTLSGAYLRVIESSMQAAKWRQCFDAVSCLVLTFTLVSTVMGVRWMWKQLQSQLWNRRRQTFRRTDTWRWTDGWFTTTTNIEASIRYQTSSCQRNQSCDTLTYSVNQQLDFTYKWCNSRYNKQLNTRAIHLIAHYNLSCITEDDNIIRVLTNV